MIPFAQLLKRCLLNQSEEQLCSIEPEANVQDVVFRSLKETRPGLPDEVKSILEAERELPLLQGHSVESLAEVLSGANVVRQDSPPRGWLFSVSSHFRKDCCNDKSIAAQLMRAIIEICRDPIQPRGDTIKALTHGDLKGKWRFRIGDYRIIYFPDPSTRTVYLLRACWRGEHGLYD